MPPQTGAGRLVIAHGVRHFCDNGAATLRPGTLIDERYVIVARVGAGGMGTIFRADDRREGRPVALKILRGNDTTDVERFVREAAILTELDHPNIVRYVGHGLTDEGAHYLAMEWLDGEDLAARIARARLSDVETLAIMRQAVAALACAHERGAVHRDIKPSNLFLRDKSVEHLAIVDFGVAGLAGDARRLTQTGMLLGTPGYMAPEQVEGSPVHDPRSDVFSLGCVLFECLTGRPAFEGANPMAVLAKLLIQESPRLADLRPEIPELDVIVGRMLAKSPADRPQTILDVAAELDRLPPSVVTRTPRPAVSDLATTLHSADSTRERQAALGRSEQRLAKLDPKQTQGEVDESVYLRAVDGMTYGEDPREGFFKDGTFYHPELAFSIRMPSGFRGINTKQAVAATNEQGDAAFQLQRAPDMPPGEALRAFVEQSGVRVQSGPEPLANGVAATFLADTEQGRLAGLIAFVMQRGHTFQLLGVSEASRFEQYASTFAQSMQSFREVTDKRVLDVPRNVLEVQKVEKETSLSDLAKQFDTVSLEEIAVLNQTRPNAELEPGDYAKLVAPSK